LIKLGKQRIAHIAGTRDNRPALDRETGYKKALEENQINFDPALVQEGFFTQEGGYKAAMDLLDNQPDGIFAASDIMAVGAIRAAKERGLSIPGDLAIVGYDDLPPSQNADPPITTVHQPIREFGVNAVEMLIDLISNGNNLPHQAVYDTRLVVRQSCGAKPR
jgi:DNA-binding LacI/PurR family transcriptional regulator